MPTIEIKNVNQKCKVSFLNGYSLTLEIRSDGEVILMGDKNSVSFDIDTLCKIHFYKLLDYMKDRSGNYCCRCKNWEIKTPSKGLPQYHNGARVAGTCALKGKQAPFDLVAYDSNCSHFELDNKRIARLEEITKGGDSDGN